MNSTIKIIAVFRQITAYQRWIASAIKDVSPIVNCKRFEQASAH